MDKLPHKPNHKWDKDTIDKVLRDIAVTGSPAVTHKTFPHVPIETIHSWVKSDDGVAMLAELHSIKAKEHRAAYSRIVDAAQAQTLATIADATPGQANLIACQATDKVRLHDNMPHRVSDTGMTPAMVAEQFRAMSTNVLKDKVLVPRNSIVEGSHSDQAGGGKSEE